MQDDLQLLERYATGQPGREEAFAELVRRHLDLVHSTALRMLNGDSHRAKDVVQLVFANLARRSAQLPAGTILTGWLYRDTSFTAKELLRAERRRTAREALAMKESQENEAPVEWEQVRPVLDQALEELGDADRDAILLRFFENRSLMEVGQRLGVGESGASRRVAGALDRLRTALVRKGMHTSALALGSAISTHAVHAAPEGLAGGVAAASMSQAAATPLLWKSAFLVMKTKVVLGTTLLAITLTTAIGVGSWRRYAAGRAQAQAAERAYLAEQRQHIAPALPLLVELIRHAADHQGSLPSDLAGIAQADARFELVPGSRIPVNPGANPTVILRERQSWQTATGRRGRVYGYSDGHAVVLRSGEAGFED